MSSRNAVIITVSLILLAIAPAPGRAARQATTSQWNLWDDSRPSNSSSARENKQINEEVADTTVQGEKSSHVPTQDPIAVTRDQGAPAAQDKPAVEESAVTLKALESQVPVIAQAQQETLPAPVSQPPAQRIDVNPEPPASGAQSPSQVQPVLPAPLDTVVKAEVPPSIPVPSVPVPDEAAKPANAPAVVASAVEEPGKTPKDEAKASTKPLESAGAVPVEVSANYLIGPGDILDISVWKDEALSKTVVVLPDGKIQFPLIGEIVAEGRTVAQIKEEIASKLSGYVSELVLSIEVKQSNSMLVYVIGRVNAPGRQILNANVNVLQVLAMAGGLNPFANRDDIKVFRKDGGKTIIVPFRYNEVVKGRDLADNIELKRGDVIVVP